jgi:hypothetical protein
VTAAYNIPPGWVSQSTSRKPLLLVNAFAFSRSSTPPPDQWTHFVKLRPIPWHFVALCALIVAFCVWAIVGVIQNLEQAGLVAIGVLAMLGAGVLFFGWFVVRAIASYYPRVSWPHLHGLGMGTSGLSYRLGGDNTDVPWGDVTSIQATFTDIRNGRKANIPVLRVQYSGIQRDLNTRVLGASPVVVYWALLYYWLTPASRDELGTTVAQGRMDGWLNEVSGTVDPSAAAPTPTP